MPLTPRHFVPDPALLALRSVCHELRPPVVTLSALVRALEQQPSEEGRAELISLALAHTDHVQAVLQEAASVASGLAAPPDVRVPLRQVLAGVAAVAPAGRMTVLAGPGAARSPVPGQHTHQILSNLITNAARYTSGPILLGARRGLRWMRLTVSDAGGPTPGLVRALRRQTPPPGDDGLGLWVTRRLVAAHGGRIRMRPGRSPGLVMEVLLPHARGWPGRASDRPRRVTSSG